jgi:hypothetical protein
VRYPFVMPLMLLAPAIVAPAQVSVGVSLPGLSIGINQPVYPDLVPVPGYPVYYAPGSASNYFFYDGMYWVYQNDNWYSSEWYNGPWGQIGPDAVPLYLLRVPVSYYRQPPPYFGGWDRNSPPRWGEHWGHDWEQHRNGWDHWDHNARPAMAPLPTYQRQFSGGRYPQGAQQQALHSQNYHYQPKEAVVRQQYQQQRTQAAAAGHGNPGADQRGQPAPGQRPNNPPPAQRGQPAPGQRPNNPPPAQRGQPAPGQRPNNPTPAQRPQSAPVQRPNNPPPPQRPQPAPGQRPNNPPPAPHPQPAPGPRSAPQQENHEVPHPPPQRGQEHQPAAKGGEHEKGPG